MRLKWGEEKRKKYKIYAHKLYIARDVAKRIGGIEEKKIIDLLEEKKTIGRKMGPCWFIRGSEIIKIKELLKGEKKDAQTKASGPVVGRADGKRIKKK